MSALLVGLHICGAGLCFLSLPYMTMPVEKSMQVMWQS